jgi:small conductance mechanosensitive channel
VISDYEFTILAIVAAFIVAAVLVRAARGVVHRALDAMEVSADSRRALHIRATRLIDALRLLAFAVAALASVSLALARFGVTEPRWDPRVIVEWLLTHGVNLVVIVIGAAIVLRTGNLLIDSVQHRLARSHRDSDLEWQRRASTLSGILTSTVTVTVWFVTVLMVLRELAIDVMPILTGAGIAGLAIGFGAQNLVRDVISGFFLILEDQVRVGDIARINGVTGVVEQINLRTVVLRDSEGAVQVFPNGTVTALANMSKQFAYAVVDVRVVYSENLDRVFNTIRDVGRDMQADPRWAAVLIDQIEVLGVTSLADGFATITTKFKTLPLNQGRVANELRRRLLLALARRGVKPYAS